MFSKKINKIIQVVLVFGILLIAGCATTKPTNPQDPYENFNRNVFAFNMAVDKAFFRPVATLYDRLFPWPVKKGATNFFSNIGDVTTTANDLLQARFGYAAHDFARFVINSTIGIFGLFDVATHLGLKKHYEDFGLTLAHWGAKKTPYLVLPFLGPSTVRDAIAIPVNYQALTPWPYVEPTTTRYAFRSTDLVNRRANLLPGDQILDQAFDPYVFMRNAYLQRRQAQISKNGGKTDSYVATNSKVNPNYAPSSPLPAGNTP